MALDSELANAKIAFELKPLLACDCTSELERSLISERFTVCIEGWARAEAKSDEYSGSYIVFREILKNGDGTFKANLEFHGGEVHAKTREIEVKLFMKLLSQYFIMEEQRIISKAE